ncbi:MAG: hypothetical protein JSS70_12330 [Bacteroidetes bacterium]|nr:hypothetical protein [Bacteroidota bacterium]
MQILLLCNLKHDKLTMPTNDSRFTTGPLKPALLSGLILISLATFSQQGDSTKKDIHFSGSVGATNNGISIIPTFTLGKPALITNFSLSKGRISFEPDLRFSMEGKPWGLVFWFRYKLVEGQKFHFNIGAHPAFAFVSKVSVTDSMERTKLVAQHYAAIELVPTYMLSENISIGIYYLHGRGIGEGTLRYSHFVTVNSSFSNLKLPGKLSLAISPQIYYLQLVDQQGVYCSSDFSIKRENLPFSFSAFINKTIHSNIEGNKNILWNMTLTYFFKVESKQH